MTKNCDEVLRCLNECTQWDCKQHQNYKAELLHWEFLQKTTWKQSSWNGSLIQVILCWLLKLPIFNLYPAITITYLFLITCGSWVWYECVRFICCGEYSWTAQRADKVVAFVYWSTDGVFSFFDKNSELSSMSWT